MADTGNGAELLIDMKLQIAKLLLQKGFENVSAIEIGERVAAAFRKHFAGAKFYLTKGTDEIKARHRRILDMHKTGSGIAEIIRASRLGSSQVYAIIRESRMQSGKEIVEPHNKDSATNKLLKDMHFCITRALAQNKIAVNDAYVMGEQTVQFIYDRWQGVVWQLPPQGVTGSRHWKAERASNIFADFNRGMTYEDLADKYSIEMKSAHGIIKRMRKRRKEPK